jgi:hypothetical protein
MNALRPIHIQLALTALSEGAQAIRAGQTDAGLRLIEHGGQYLQQFLDRPEIVKGAVARAHAVLRARGRL